VRGNVFYSYATPIALRKENEDGTTTIYMVNRKFSVTTSRHQHYVRAAAGDRLRLVPVEEFKRLLTEDGNFSSFGWLSEAKGSIFKPAGEGEVQKRRKAQRDAVMKELEKARESGEEVTFGPGVYWLGDICYVLRDDIYDDVWGKQYHYEEGTFEFEGKEFAVAGTAYGDGAYRGSNGELYGVDAGVIGIVPDELVDPDKAGTAMYSTELDVKKELKFLAHKGVFLITVDGREIIIDTAHQDLTELHEDVEGEDDSEIFAPADDAEIEQRREEAGRLETARKAAIYAQRKAAYAALPYTYEQIIELPEYRQIVALPGVQDVTTQLQKDHRTVAFVLTYQESVYDMDRLLWRVRERKKPYYVYHNGYLRTAMSVGGKTSVMAKFRPAQNLGEYTGLLNRMYRKIDSKIKRG
jgi:hypothetical protein